MTESDAWHDVPEDKWTAWVAIFSTNREGMNLSVACPVCGAVQLHRYYLKGRAVDREIEGKKFVAHGAVWEWCSNCRSYLHASALVPNWWWDQLHLDKTKLTHNPGPLEQALAERANQSMPDQKPPVLCFAPINETTARALLDWRYPPPYDLYDTVGDDLDSQIRFFADPRNNYYGISDEHGELLAFCCFGADARVPGGAYVDKALDLGLGMHPDMTGQGLGRQFVASLIAFARTTFAPPRLRVTIAEFNRRAQRVWQDSGFVQVEHFRSPAGRPFVVLSHDED